MTDPPMDDPSARIKAAADQFGAALSDAMSLAFRKAVVKQVSRDYGPGPWVLYPDGRVEPIEDDYDEGAMRGE